MILRTSDTSLTYRGEAVMPCYLGHPAGCHGLVSTPVLVPHHDALVVLDAWLVVLDRVAGPPGGRRCPRGRGGKGREAWARLVSWQPARATILRPWPARDQASRAGRRQGARRPPCWSGSPSRRQRTHTSARP